MQSCDTLHKRETGAQTNRAHEVFYNAETSEMQIGSGFVIKVNIKRKVNIKFIIIYGLQKTTGKN